MNCTTYSLKLDQENSDDYYNIVRDVSIKIKEKILFGGNDYLNDFMQFIVSENIELLRSKEEYGLELLLIGVMLEEYIDNVRCFKVMTKGIFVGLNKLRDRHENYKKKIDTIRGKLATKILMRRKHTYKDIIIDDFDLLIKWMESSGDFKEEIIRLKNWDLFFKEKGKYYSADMFIYCKILATQFYNISKDVLGLYTKDVNKYLDNYEKDHTNKDDIVYCGKGEIQYFFNMISAEIINNIYRNEFLKSKEKIVLLPSCMREVNTLCLSDKTYTGYKCSHCCSSCNINKLSTMGERYGLSVFIMTDECENFKFESEYNSTGAIVISCVLNLFSKNLKFIRLGLSPQCSILDYCGCTNHWCREDIMTNINLEELKNIICNKDSK